MAQTAKPAAERAADDIKGTTENAAEQGKRAADKATEVTREATERAVDAAREGLRVVSGRGALLEVERAVAMPVGRGHGRAWPGVRGPDGPADPAEPRDAEGA